VQPAADITRLVQENAELRGLLDEMRTLLAEASEQEQQHLEQQMQMQTIQQESELRQQDYLEEIRAKNDAIETLERQFEEIEASIASGSLAPPAPPKTRGELEEWADELEKESFKLTQERRELNNDRQQLREDEKALEKQMRDMEVQMARERALLARQEMELRRLNDEIQRELELMQRGDASLREQLSKFQRRHQEVMTRTGAPAPAPSGGSTPPSQPTPPPNKESGLVRRLFGSQSPPGNKS